MVFEVAKLKATERHLLADCETLGRYLTNQPKSTTECWLSTKYAIDTMTPKIDDVSKLDHYFVNIS